MASVFAMTNYKEGSRSESDDNPTTQYPHHRLMGKTLAMAKKIIALKS